MQSLVTLTFGLLLAANLGRALAEPPVQAPAGSAKPAVWMIPPSYDRGRCFRELFEQPEAWRETRSVIDVLAYTDLNMNKLFSDEQLRAWFPKLQQWGIKFALEVGALKPWGTTGEKTFNIERPMWDRVQRLGGSIYAIAMDEPLCCTRKEIHKPDVIESWVNGPARCLPDSGDFTFTRSVRDFSRKFVKRESTSR